MSLLQDFITVTLVMVAQGRLKKYMHYLRSERKHTLHLKSDNKLALYLLCAHDQLQEIPVAQSIHNSVSESF